MSEANYTARANAKANIIALANNITLQRDENGRFTHDAAERFKTLFQLQLGACYNDQQPGEGMRKLIEPGDNVLTTIKSTDRITPDTVLRASKNEADALARATNIAEKPKIETRADAKVEADDQNYAIQATIGTKEGAAEVISNIVGSDVTDHVLKHADGSPKGVDEYRLSDIFAAVAAAAKRPTEKEMLSLKISALQYRFDWRKSFQINMEQLRLLVQRITSYKLSFDSNDYALVILGNVYAATQHDFGRDFREPLRSLRQLYRYDHKHDNVSLAAIIKQLTAADSLRDPADAPAPESANAVTDSKSLLSDFVSGLDFDEYAEEAMGVSEDDSDSGQPRPRRGKSNNSRGDRNRGGRGRSKSRDRTPTRWQDNPCKYCKLFKRRMQHPHTPTKDCYWNARLKVWRPRRVCDEMEIAYVPQHKFAANSDED